MGISKGRGKSCCIFFFSFCFVTMKFFALIACLAVASAYDQAWEDYKLEFNKLYTAAEELTRYANWKKQSEDVDLHNAMYGHEFTLAINELSDLSEEEYQKIYLSGLRVPKGPSNATMYVPTSDAIPNAIDWRSKGMVTGVKNQGQWMKSLLSDTEAKVVRITTWSRTRGEPDGEPEDTSRWHETGQTTAVLHPNHPTRLSKLIEINGNDRWMEEDMNLLFEHF